MMKRRWRLLACTGVLAILVVFAADRAIQAGWADAIAHEWRFAGSEFQCNICGRTFGRFDQGTHTSNELQCPFCESRPRHRTAYKYFRERSDLFDGRPKKMLHIAPERSLGPIFKEISNIDYVSGDLDAEAAMVQMDIMNIQYPAQSFDVLYCQFDHVRAYGPDFVDRLRESGCSVTVDDFASTLTNEDVHHYGLSREPIYVCRKNPAS